MRTKFTFFSNKLLKASFLLAMLAGFMEVRAQDPLLAGTTYYVNGVGNDLVAPKDTFANLSGLYTAGNPYNSSTGIISALNANGIEQNSLGQLTILLVNGYTGIENFSANGIIVNHINYASASRPVLLKPAVGTNITISSGALALSANAALFRFNGTQFFTIDGDQGNGQRGLSFAITSTPQTTCRVIDIIGSSIAPINTVAVKNVNITGSSTASAVNTYAGVYIGGPTLNSNSVRRNANISVINCDIQGVQYGVYARGVGSATSGAQDVGLIVRNNRIGGSALIGGLANAAGIMLSNQANAFVEYNVISRNLNNQTGFKGIELSNIAGAASLDSNIVINANTIHNLTAISGGVTGIRVALGNHQQPLNLKITNNSIAKITSPGSATINSFTYPIGILVEDSTMKAGIDIINNSVALTGATLTGSSSACLVTGTLTVSGIRVFNNVFSNRMQNLLNNNIAYNIYAVIVARNPVPVNAVNTVIHPFDSIDNNVYDVTTTGGWANIGYTILNNYVSVLEWASYTNYDKGSLNTKPYFDNDSTLFTSNGAGTIYANAGRAMLVFDRNGVSRPTNNSSIGAYQFTQNTNLAFAPLMGGVTYQINGVDNFPTNANPSIGSFASYASFVNHLNSFGTQGTGTIGIVFASGYLQDLNVAPAIMPYPGMLGTRPIRLSAASGVSVNLTVGNTQVVCNNSGIIRLYGASFFEIDGSNGAGGKAITISLPQSANSNQTKLVILASTLMHTTSYFTIRNCNLIGSSSATATNTFAAIYAGAANVPAGFANAVGGANTNILIGDNNIEAVRNGIYWRAKSGQTDQFVTIVRNQIGGTIAPNGTLPTTFIGGTVANQAGIYIKGVSQSLIDSNIVRNSIPTATGFRGIDLDAISGETGGNLSLTITRNTIVNLGTTNGYAVGIRVASNDPARGFLIANNFIAKIYGTGSSAINALSSPTGIAFEVPNAAAGAVTMGVNVINNTIHLSPVAAAQVTSSAYTTAVFFDPRSSGITFRNNLFSNKYGRTVAGTVSNCYIYTIGGSLSPFTETNTNVYFTGGDVNFTNNQIGIWNTTPATQLFSLFELRSSFLGDGSSIYGEVPFLTDSTNTFDPFYVGHFAKAFIRNNLAVTDIAGNGRNSSNSTAGALEINANFSPLIGGNTYTVNGILAPPSKTTPGIGSFNTINNLFRYINTNGVDDGNNPPLSLVNIVIESGYAGEGDTLITALHDYPRMGPNRIIVIKPNTGVSPTIAPTAATTRSQFSAAAAVLRFQGARYVTIDGSNDGGVTRNLTIRVPATPGNPAFVNNALTRVIDVMGWSQPATDITIKNCNILGYSNTTTIFSYAAIYQGGVQFNAVNPVPNSQIREKNNNNTYENNFIGGVKYGVYLRGNSSISGGYDLRTKVINNTIGGNDSINGPVATNYFGGINNAAGILVSYQAAATIERNTIKNNVATFNLNSGIELSNPNIPSPPSQWNTDSAISVVGNTITNIRGTTASYGIYTNIRWDGLKSINIYNNMISGITGQGAAPAGAGFANNPYGILLDGTLPVTIMDYPEIDLNVANNSINLGPATTLGGAGVSACLGVATNTRGKIVVVNNIFQNRLSRASAGGNIYAIAAAAANNPLLYTDYNNYYVAGAFGGNHIAGLNLAASAVNYTTLANWSGFNLQDTLSMSIATPFTSDVNLLIPNGTSSPLYQAGMRVSFVNRDVLDLPRPGLSTGISTIGAHEFVGSYSDIFSPKAYDYTRAFEFCPDPTGSAPISVNFRIMDKNPIINDTLYYRINGGTEASVVATVKNGLSRTYEIPGQPMNTKISYRVGGKDNANQTINFINTDERSGYNYTTTTMTIDDTRSVIAGFDLPNEYNWAPEQIAGVGAWNVRGFGSVVNPVLAPLTGSRAAVFSAANGVASRLVSPCLDFGTSKKPTLRIFISQNADNLVQNDSIQVTIGGFGNWITLPSLYPIYRTNGNFVVPGYKVYDFCMEELYGQSGFKIGIEAYSKGGGAVIIDSIVIFDNFLSLPVSPKNQINCFNDSVNVFISNADSKFEYRLYDMLTQRFVGNYVTGNDATLRVQGFMNNVDSAYLQVFARNLTSNCTNFMYDTAIVHFRNFKNGPFVAKGNIFQGQYNTGDFFTPDAVKVGGQAMYKIVAPKGTSNSSYGTDWTISKVSMYKYFYDQPKNAYVKIDSASTFSYIVPTPTTDGYVLVSGMPVDSNKTFQLEVTVKLLPQGCDSIVNRYVTIANAPIANFFAPNDTLCQNINNQFTNVSTTGAFTLPMQYTWDFGDGTFANVASPIKRYTTPGTYRILMIVKNNTTLLDSLSTTVVVLPSPVANFTSTLSCAGKVTRFTSIGTNEAGNFYRFNIGGQVADSNIVDAIVQGSDTVINANLYVRNTLGCTDTLTKAIQVFAQPKASFTALDVCAGNSVQFSNSSTIDAGKNGRVNTFGSEWAFGNGDAGFSNNPLYFYPQGGSYRAVLKVISNYGCTDTVSRVVSIYNKPVVNFTLDNTCKGSSLVINNNTTFADGLGKLRYRWNFGDNTLPRTEAVPVKTFGAIGSYFVTLLATDTLNGCFDSLRIVAQVKEKAMADFTVDNGCVNKGLLFTNQSIVPANTTPTFSYQFGDNTTSSSPNPTHTYVTSGSKTINLTVDIDGCKDVATKTIIISSPITVEFAKEWLSHNNVKFTSNRTGLARYSWDFGDGTPVLNTSSNVVTHIFERKGVNNVTLTVQDSNACDAMFTDTVSINRNVGMNDILAEQLNFNVYPNPFATSTKVVFDLDKSEKVTLEVYDMLGRKVYTNNAGNLNAGSHSMEVNESNFDAKSAVYMIRLTIGTNVISRQLVKQ